MLISEGYPLKSRANRHTWTAEETDGIYRFSCPEGYRSPTYTVVPLGDEQYRFEWMGWDPESRDQVLMSKEFALVDLREWMDRFNIPNEVRPEQFQSLKSKNGGRRWIDGQWCRLRRGRWVPIPQAWVGAVTYKETIMKRPSKQGGKRYRKRREH